MDLPKLILLGIGALGIGAVVLVSSPGVTAQPGGAFGGGGATKKGGLLADNPITEAPLESAPIYNILFEAPIFPSIPDLPILADVPRSNGSTGGRSTTKKSTTKKSRLEEKIKTEQKKQWYYPPQTVEKYVRATEPLYEARNIWLPGCTTKKETNANSPREIEREWFGGR